MRGEKIFARWRKNGTTIFNRFYKLNFRFFQDLITRLKDKVPIISDEILNSIFLESNWFSFSLLFAITIKILIFIPIILTHIFRQYNAYTIFRTNIWSIYKWMKRNIRKKKYINIYIFQSENINYKKTKINFSKIRFLLCMYKHVKYTLAFQVRSPTSNYIKTRQLIINQVHYDIV